MMKIIYNLDGSIKEKFINEVIEQGSNNVTKIGFKVDSLDLSEYAITASFKLPNDRTIIPQVVTTTEDGFYVLKLSSDVTLLDGTLTINYVITKQDETLVTDNLYLYVNKTGVSANDPVIITRQQYESFFTSLSGKEDSSNKVTEITSLSTNTQYPSAKCVYDSIKRLYVHTINARSSGGGNVTMYFTTNEEEPITDEETFIEVFTNSLSASVLNARKLVDVYIKDDVAGKLIDFIFYTGTNHTLTPVHLNPGTLTFTDSVVEL